MTYFQRGQGPLVSVMLPTRARPRHALESITSLLDTATDPGMVQVLVRTDDDDPAKPDWGAMERYSATVRNFPFLIAISGPRFGYAGLHRYYNELAAAATGDWLLLWNDDARMTTDGWDDVLADMRSNIAGFRGHDGLCLVMPNSLNTGLPMAEFPFTRRAASQRLGLYCRAPHMDTYLSELYHGLGAVVNLPEIVIDHQNAQIWDALRDENNRAIAEVTQRLHAEAVALHLIPDRQRLRGGQ